MIDKKLGHWEMVCNHCETKLHSRSEQPTELFKDAETAGWHMNRQTNHDVCLRCQKGIQDDDLT